MEKDKKAVSLLKRYYSWNYSLQKKPLTEEEIQYCMEKGVMFPVLDLPHDRVIRDIQEWAQAIPLEEAVTAFLYSLTSADNRYRTVLSSVIWGRSVPMHHVSFASEWDERRGQCSVCGLDLGEGECCEQNLNDYSKFRYHCGEQDIHEAGYVWLDLKEYQSLPKVDYDKESIRVLNRVFGLARELGPGNKAVALQKLITAEKFFKATKNQINAIFAVLSACGVFDTPEHKSVAASFIPNDQRHLVMESEFAYPLNYWRGKHGINYDAVNRIFGSVVGDALDEQYAICGEVKRTQTEGKRTSKAAQYFTEGVHCVEIPNASRYYYGLKEINPTWDKVTKFSTTYNLYKRTEIYFDGNIVEKLIYEEQQNGRMYYQEIDMHVETQDRQLVYPKTSRGRKQPLTPTLLMTPTYMEEQLYVSLGEEGGVSSYNSRNDQYLPLPPGTVSDNEEFQEYTKRYIEQLSGDYDDAIQSFHNKNRVTVSIHAGAVFRARLTPGTYTYGLIFGRVRDMLKCGMIPDEHPLNACMAQPILYRQYDIVTERGDMTPEELESVPLRTLDCAQDNEILWETYPIVGYKKLQEADIDLGFGIYERSRSDFNAATMGKKDPYRRKGKLAVVMGFGVEWFDEDLFGTIPERLLNASDYYATGISMKLPAQMTEFDRRALELRGRVEDCLGLSRDNSMDEFALKYGGITRRRFIELAEQYKL